MRVRSSSVVIAGAVTALSLASSSSLVGGAAASTDPPAGSADVTPEWESIVDAAVGEGKVVLYAVNFPEQNERLEAAFEQEYPEIDLEIVRVTSEIDAKLDSERETGVDGADISFGVNYPWVLDAEAAGDLAPIEVGPNVAAWVGTPWLDAERNYLVGTTQVLGFGWNTDLLEGEPPQEWSDLLNPEYAGMIGFTEPASPVIADFWSFAEEQLGGEDGLRQLAELDPVFYASGVPLMQGLGAGEISVTGYASAQLEADKAAGAPVEFFVPSPAWTSANLVYLPSWAHRPNAAQVLADFIASPAGQEALSINGASPLDGIESALVDIDDVQVVDITRTPEWAEEYIARWSDIFGR
ncbi:ABC transporter substrate-binding protein [Desertimonas flava]|jgi:iron(III) transport system substrate-binding protein|uniref:ABC transporter substrate-binding protein n=1 Tax=Desertimonas flava TaxID=2064846 RepID=UPI000E343600|nr:extracellular solute-binding protein [Desertimonas flava]